MRRYSGVMNRNLARIGLLAALITLTPSLGQSPPATRPAVAEEIGSTRNSVVAFPMPAGTRETLTFLCGEMDEAEANALKAAAPNVRIISGLNRETAVQHAAEAHGIDVRVLSPRLLEAAPKWCWVMGLSAGVDRYMGIKPLVDNDRIVLTNMRAVHGPAIADHAMAMLLSLTRNLRFYDAAQRERQWAERDTPAPSTSLHGKTMLVVGIGGIGEEIARRAHGCGMRVIATRRSEAPAPDFVERVGKPSDMIALLAEADVVAIATPLTPETDGLFDAKAFAAMKHGSILINIARGGIVRTDALMEALTSGKLAGACLDVTDPEPLPPDHALWKMKNVIITPQVAGDAEVTEQRHFALMVENMRRFGAGEPLLNVVDKKAGY